MTITEWPWFAVLLLAIQGMLLVSFSFFAFFNFLYGWGSLRSLVIKRVPHSGRRIAVVIVSFNEEHVLEKTLKACEALTYRNKLIVLADDSTDPTVVESLRALAKERGCVLRDSHPFIQEMELGRRAGACEPIEIWESPGFVLFHRPKNVGYKAGSLRKVQEYLHSRDIELMYLLDADWHPQSDALERTLGVLEANDTTAFVQTKRISFPQGMNLFQKYVSFVEEGCYYVDFEGRQRLGHPTLFSGCCTLFRLDAVAAVGGFTPGHLTEDLDLTDRLWLAGWKGVYDGSVVNYGEVPFTYDHYRRQQERWASGSARALRDYFWPIITSSRLTVVEKLSAFRQNAYFTTTLLTGLAIAIGIISILWLILAWNSYPVEFYLFVIGQVKLPFVILLYFCLLSNIIEPLVMILAKTRRYRDVLHLPMMVWYAWSVIPTYVTGNIKGLFHLNLDWFRTPKYHRDQAVGLPRSSITVRAVHIIMCVIFVGMYAAEGWVFGWFDEFAWLLLPAFVLASMK